VPVLVAGADLPATQQLPAPLRPLSQRQALRIDDETFR
jgi:hypothetical protein